MKIEKGYFTKNAETARRASSTEHSFNFNAGLCIPCIGFCLRRTPSPRDEQFLHFLITSCDSPYFLSLGVGGGGTSIRMHILGICHARDPKFQLPKLPLQNTSLSQITKIFRSRPSPFSAARQIPPPPPPPPLRIPSF